VDWCKMDLRGVERRGTFLNRGVGRAGEGTRNQRRKGQGEPGTAEQKDCRESRASEGPGPLTPGGGGRSRKKIQQTELRGKTAKPEGIFPNTLGSNYPYRTKSSQQKEQRTTGTMVR